VFHQLLTLRADQLDLMERNQKQSSKGQERLTDVVQASGQFPPGGIKPQRLKQNTMGNRNFKN
jgi:hypothetical protein